VRGQLGDDPLGERGAAPGDRVISPQPAGELLPHRLGPDRGAATRRSRSARVGLADVAVADGHLEVLGAEPPGQLLGDDHRAVPSAGAPDRDGEVPAALGRVVVDAQESSSLRRSQSSSVCGSAST